MKRLRIYVDTSVIGGCFDPEFSIWSMALFGEFARGVFQPLTSQVVTREVECAPKPVQAKFQELLSFHPEIIELDREVLEIRQAYVRRGILPPRFDNDLLHIALATWANADLLVSWNFRQIVRFDKILQYNSVNLGLGYRPIQIFSPREVVPHEDDDD